MTWPRMIVSVVVGLTVGSGVSFLVNRAVYGSPVGGSGSMAAFVQVWGLMSGVMAAGLVAGLLLTVRVGSVWKKRFLYLGALSLGCLGGGAGSWILGWRFSLFTLEGAWLYPLAVFSLLGAGVLLRRARDVSRRETKEQGRSDATPRELRVW
jgi:hypothetical protein